MTLTDKVNSAKWEWWSHSERKRTEQGDSNIPAASLLQGLSQIDGHWERQTASRFGWKIPSKAEKNPYADDKAIKQAKESPCLFHCNLNHAEEMKGKWHCLKIAWITKDLIHRTRVVQNCVFSYWQLDKLQIISPLKVFIPVR